MGLTFKSIRFENFRSFSQFGFDDIGELTILVGPNAAGKTNAIEGIQLLCTQSSFRNSTNAVLLHEDAPCARVSAEVEDEVRKLQLQLQVFPQRRSFSLNGKEKRGRELRGLIPAISFTPDDLALVKGSNAQRRCALDALGVQVNANYQVLKRDYEKVIRYKNKLLRDEAPDGLLESMNDTLITCGAQLVCYRHALFARLRRAVVHHYVQLCAGREQMDVRYTPSWQLHASSLEGEEEFGAGEYSQTNEEASQRDAFYSRDEVRELLAQALAARRAEERARKRAVVGPHADHIDFLLNGRPAAEFASQGQQRSMVLAWKFAEATVAEDILDQKPLMLLDDVMSELDEERRRALVEFILKEAQTFITTTNLQYFDDELLQRAKIITLEGLRAKGTIWEGEQGR